MLYIEQLGQVHLCNQIIIVSIIADNARPINVRHQPTRSSLRHSRILSHRLRWGFNFIFQLNMKPSLLSSLQSRPVTNTSNTSVMSRHRLVWLSLAQMSLASINILATVVMMINFNFQSQYNWSLYSGPWVGHNNNCHITYISLLTSSGSSQQLLLNLLLVVFRPQQLQANHWEKSSLTAETSGLLFTKYLYWPVMFLLF